MDAPLKIHQSATPGDGRLHAVGEVHRVLVLPPRHRRQVPHVANDRPRAHHVQKVVQHAVAGAVPERVTETWIVSKRKAEGMGDR